MSLHPGQSSFPLSSVLPVSIPTSTNYPTLLPPIFLSYDLKEPQCGVQLPLGPKPNAFKLSLEDHTPQLDPISPFLNKICAL